MDNTLALYFDPDGYIEQIGPGRVSDGPAGLMGRQVAGKEFLDAFLTFGRWDVVTAVVRSRDRAEPLVKLCREHPSSRSRQRRLFIVEEADFFTHPVSLLHAPCPPDARFAWARHAVNPMGFALSGVTHTLSTPAAVQALCDLVLAPFEPFDALVCTSHAVVEMVRAVTDSFTDYLRERFGGTPALRPRLELIPLGVNVERFHLPNLEERSRSRTALGVLDDEVMVLSVGRLSHHAKAHPFPVFHAAQEAVRRTGCKVHLVFAGWAAHSIVSTAYREAAAQFAPAVRVSFVDGQNPIVRKAVWPAADAFISLPDNIQETFGLVIVEAMASGLPVVASDWDGYRDLVVNGETGYLVPTRMVRGATANATQRLLFGELKYDHFLAECSQAAAVDCAAAAEALTRLVLDAGLRRRMGAIGRARAASHFAWERVIRAYETLWEEQRHELAKHRTSAPRANGPVRYPAPERSFAGYPSAWLDDGDRVRAMDGAMERLSTLLATPLTNHVAERRCASAALIASLLTRSRDSRTVGEMAAALERDGVDLGVARATIAWLIKYDLLVPAV